MRPLPSISPIHFLGKEIKPVTVAKDLGVMIDSSRSFQFSVNCFNVRLFGVTLLKLM